MAAHATDQRELGKQTTIMPARSSSANAADGTLTPMNTRIATGSAVERNRQHGFTLIELMITVAIIGILAAIAYPSYQQHIVKTNRTDAQAFLMTVAQKQQQRLMMVRSYAGGDDALSALQLSVPANVARSYDVTVTSAGGPPPTFTATATPKSGTSQVSDGNLSIDQAENKLWKGNAW